MYKIFKKNSPYKIRDINIAISYHNTGRSLKSVGDEYNMSAANTERIHHEMVRHIAICLGHSDLYYYTYKINHDEYMAARLKEYRTLLLENNLKTEITLYSKNGDPVLILSSDLDNERIFVHVCREGATVSIEELKTALKKISSR